MAYIRAGKEYDVAVGDVPFRLASVPDLPQIVETIPVRKEQFDAEVDPGEQSLSGYWRRSQSSFHHGAGYLYEPTERSDAAFAGYYDSSGVDVHTPGVVTLLRTMDEGLTQRGGTATPDFRKVAFRGGKSVAFDENVPGKMWINYSGTGADSYDWAFTAPTGYLVYDGWPLGGGENLILTALNGTPVTNPRLYKAADFATGTTNYWAFSGNVPTIALFAKYRFWACGGNAIYQPDVSGAPDGGAAPIAPIFTNPQSGFGYTCMAEGPAAVYFGGHDGSQSWIQSITLDASGGLPTLTGATIAAVLPPGELVVAIDVLAGQYMGIATNQGFRVGKIETNGSLTYGPLLITQSPGSTGFWFGATSMCATPDSFLVATRDTAQAPRAYRVHMTEEIAPLVFPHSRVAEVNGGGTVGERWQSIACHVWSGFTGMKAREQIVTVNSATKNLWRQSLGNFVPSGWIQTSRVRYLTSEKKAFKYVDIGLGTLPSSNSVQVDAIDDLGDSTAVVSLTSLTAANTGYALPAKTSRYLSLKMTLTRSFTLTDPGPRLESFLLRAMPAVTPQRLITLPLLCFDYEQGRSGQRYGGEGFAQERLLDLQALENGSTTIVYENFSAAESPTTTSCVIESIRFSQTAVPPLGHEGAGGILLLQLRTVSP
jgi:hypothetical protein